MLKKGEINYKLSDKQIITQGKRKLYNQNKMQGSNVPLHRENAHTPAMVKHCLK